MSATKKKFLISFRMNRESYFAATALMPKIDRDISWVINKSVELGLLALAEDPHPVTEDAALRAVRVAQAARLRTLEMRDLPRVEMLAETDRA